MTSQMFIQPVDVLLFRDGRPFSAGSDHRADSLFPPHPFTLQGAIRTCQLMRLNVDLQNQQAIEEAIGTPKSFGNLRLRGPFLAKQDENARIIRYFPQPADAYSLGDHKIKPASNPKLPLQGTQTSCSTPMLIGLDDKPGKGESGLWLTEENLKSYLSGHEVQGIPSEELFVRENRLGIGTDPVLGTTLQGALYEVVFIRLVERAGFLEEMEGAGYDDWDTKGCLQLGGEYRAATYEIMQGLHPLPYPVNPLPKQFKLYFATPAYFEQGWLPTNWNKFFDGKVSLVAAALGKYETVGGVNLAHDKNRPDELHRPSRRYVPAGSVYYFKCDDDKSVTWQTSLIQFAVTELGSEIGFGQIIIEEWNNV
ncbi:MAG: type III-B CRISPR module-associated protein Cmr3 [Anaerolineaceae bacterium]